MIRDNNDLYATIKALITQLSEAGEQQWSCSLEDATSISTVPGEVLGETRLVLRKLQGSSIPGHLGVDAQVGESLAYLDQILGS